MSCLLVSWWCGLASFIHFVHFVLIHKSILIGLSKNK